MKQQEVNFDELHHVEKKIENQEYFLTNNQ